MEEQGEGHSTSLVREGHGSGNPILHIPHPRFGDQLDIDYSRRQPSGPAGSVKTASFTIGDERYMAIEAGPLDPFNHSFSIIVECEDQAELDRLWNALKEGGSAEQCGWLRDRWGLCWQIIPKRLGELMNDPDAAKRKRVAEAMLKMMKFEIAKLEAAANGA
jgi:predicted 3-demethylubiquinone-9 3-methyltransferase (glyoxalase superfamily)